VHVTLQATNHTEFHLILHLPLRSWESLTKLQQRLVKPMERSEINPEQLFEELFDKPEESEESENVRLYTLGRPTFDDVYDADFMRRVYRVGYNTASVMITTRRHLDNLTLTTYPEAEPCGDHAGKEPWILFIVQHSRNRARGPAYKVAGIVTARSSRSLVNPPHRTLGRHIPFPVTRALDMQPLE
jgi:hypothetical protein